ISVEWAPTVRNGPIEHRTAACRRWRRRTLESGIVGMRPPSGLPSLSRRSRVLLVAAVVLAALLLVGPRLVDTYTNWLWFGEVGFRGVYVTVLWTRILIFAVVGLFVGLVVWAALVLAYRSRPVFVPTAGPNDPIARYRTTVMSRLKLFGIGIPVLLGVLS